MFVIQRGSSVFLIGIVRLYAKLLFKCFHSNILSKHLTKELLELNNFILSNKEISRIFSSPIVSSKKKIEIFFLISRILNINPILEKFCILLVKNSRMPVFSDILYRYQELLDIKSNIRRVEVLYAKKLTETDKNWLSSYLEKKFKQRVKVSFLEQSSLIGGIVIRYDSIIIDYSIIGILKKISRTIKEDNLFIESNSIL